MALKFTILGCGNSSGVPASGDHWGACDPNEPRNRRTRPSLLVQSDTTNLVIDTGPDFSAQATKFSLNSLDAVLYTHSHGDHVHGIDDLKRYVFMRDDRMLDIYTNDETIDELKRRFYYLFEDGKEDIYPKTLRPNSLSCSYGRPVKINDIEFIPFEQQHGRFVQSVGFRFGNVAYSTDVKSMKDESLKILSGVDTWIVDAAGYHQDNNPVHANLIEVFEMNKIIKAKNVYLTSLSLAMDYKTLCKELPDGYKPSHDGFIIEQ